MNLEEYEKEFYSQDNFDFENSRVRIDRAVDLIGVEKLVLDVGCWGGSISKLIQDRNNKVIAVDISPKSVEKAVAKGIDARTCNITEGLPFPNESFDVVYMGDILEHLFDVEKALAEAHRVLKRGGELIITTVNVCSLRDRILILFGHLPAYYGTHKDHIRLFNRKKLEHLLKEAGFKTVLFEGLMIELPYTPSGRKFVYRGFTKKFASLATQFIIKAQKKDD